ncbi:MAG: threonine synthase [Bdellovibrionota bacterium]
MDCHARYDVFDVVYRCAKCDGLLGVVHDSKALARLHTAQGWKKVFEDRYRKNIWPFGSGVWGKKEWVLPNVDDENIVSMYEGASNLFWAERFGREIGLEDLWIKMCGNSHTGSFKDLGMTVLVSAVKQMISDGKKIPAVACASTGDTSAALAAYAASAAIPAIVFLPKNKVSLAQLIQPVANGALVLSIDTDFDGCMALVQQICTKENIYLANSMNSLRIEGQKTVGVEIIQQFDWAVPDWIIIPGGNLGNVSALGQGLLLMKELGMISKLPKVCCAQAEHANPLYTSFKKGWADLVPVQAKKTLASAIQIGNPVSFKKAVRTLQAFDGIVEQASEQELADASARCDRTGTFNCPHTGVGLAALLKLLKRGEIKKKERVIVISTAHGLKFTEFKVGYHRKQLDDVKPSFANAPIEVPNRYDDVRRAVLEGIQAKLR